MTDQLHVEEGEGAQEEHEEVGDEEGAPAVLVAQVREPWCSQEDALVLITEAMPLRCIF